jgi:hypothetical protein
MGRPCSINGERGRRGMHIGNWWESQKERGRPRHEWFDNFKMDLGETERDDIG